MKTDDSARFGLSFTIAQPRHRRDAAVGWAFGFLAVVLSMGCRSESIDSQTAELRQRFLVATEPAGAMTLTEVATRLGLAKPNDDFLLGDEARANVLGGTGEAVPDAALADASLPSQSDEAFVVVGRIFAGAMEPWDPGKASFLLAELPDEGHGEGHDADNCPFCKRKAAKAPTAIVQFVDSAGNVITTDARKLLGVGKKDVVVVRGKVSAGELNTLLITATEMHIRGG